MHSNKQKKKFNRKRNNPRKDTQPCPQCGKQIGVFAGMPDAICRNCGFKDPCCE